MHAGVDQRQEPWVSFSTRLHAQSLSPRCSAVRLGGLGEQTLAHVDSSVGADTAVANGRLS